MAQVPEQVDRSPTETERVVSMLRGVINHCSAAAVSIGAGAGKHAAAQLDCADQELDKALELFDDLRAQLSD